LEALRRGDARSRDRDSRIYLARALHAKHAGAQVVPVTELERSIWRSGVFEADGARTAQRATAVASRARIPMFDLKPAELLAARESLDGFAEWRSWLADVCTQAYLLAGDDTAALHEEIQERLESRRRACASSSSCEQKRPRASRWAYH
jgi:hypothetical protein